MIVKLMCQSAWAKRCPDGGQKIISGYFCQNASKGTSIWIEELSKAHSLLNVGGHHPIPGGPK